MPEPWFVRMRPGVFLSWTDDGPQLCHVDKPLDVFALSADMVRLIVRLDPETPVDEVLADLEVPAEVHGAVREALRTLIEAGMLTDARGTAEPVARGDVPLRDTGQEAARRMLAHPDIEKLAPDFLALYRSLNRSTLTSVPLAYALHQAVRYVVRADLPGSIVECGVWRGGSMALAATVLAELGDVRRELWLYDTFDWHWEQVGDRDGFTLLGNLKQAGIQEIARDDDLRAGTSVAEVRALLASTGYPAELTHLVPGYVQETIPAQAPEQIAVLRLDTDLYDSTLHELEQLYPRLVPGGVLIVDDYGKLDGATLAVDEYLRTLSDPPLLTRVDIQGRVAVKPGARPRPAATADRPATA